MENRDLNNGPYDEEKASTEQPSLTFHKFADLWPPMSKDEYQELLSDIKAHGLQKPITLYQGKILDGRNRYRALLELGIEDQIKTVAFEGDDTMALNYVISSNIRRNLTASQKAIAIADCEEVRETLLRESESTKGASLEIDQPSDPNDRKTDSKLGKIAGCSRTYIWQAREIKKKDPGLADEVRNGGKSIPAATKVLEQRAVASKIKKLNPFLDKIGPFNTIVENFIPPDGEEKSSSGSSDISRKEFLSGVTRELAEVDSYLFMRTTNEFLLQAIKEFCRLGYKYRATFTIPTTEVRETDFAKINTDLVLFGTKGNLPLAADDRRETLWAIQSDDEDVLLHHIEKCSTSEFPTLLSYSTTVGWKPCQKVEKFLPKKSKNGGKTERKVRSKKNKKPAA